MDEIVELDCVKNVCRLCLSTDKAKIEIFDLKDSPVSFAKQIHDYLSIEVVPDDRLSTLVCDGCIERVQGWHTYKESCAKSQDKLQQWLTRQTNTTTANNKPSGVKPEPMENANVENVAAIEVVPNEEPAQAENPEEEEMLVEEEVVAEEDNMSVTEMEEEAPAILEEQEKQKSPTPKPRKRQRSPSLSSAAASPKKSNSTIEQIEIKSEPDDYDSDGNVDIESVTESELLINPMALATNKDIIEPDSTQKFTTNRLLRKKKSRGPHTHFRGVKAFKKKCPYCQIHLHSKFSYTKHMERYHHNIGATIVQKQSSNILKNGGLTFEHNIKNRKQNDGNTTEEDDEYDDIDEEARRRRAAAAAAAGEGMEEEEEEEIIDEDDDDDVYNDVNNGEIEDDDEEEESIEDVEDELVSMEKNAPLTQVQENIISQLKTFSCYSCQQVFNDRRSTLNHIRQHMPDLRPYTCIACLTEFPDRSIYKLHCGASFECAMKIALVTPKHGTEKYFTCNMCLRPLHNRKDLLSHLSKHSDRQFEQLTSPQKLKTIQQPPQQQEKTPRKQQNNQIIGGIDSGFIIGPYKNGDPAHNHTCIYCGMIYKYKPNMIKHQELCKRLPPEERNSYHCADCGMTFLVFKKFQSHIHVEHQRKDTICYICGMKYKLSHEFLLHHQKHRTNKLNNTVNKPNKLKNDNNTKQITKYGCPLCPDEFLTRIELQHHKTSHLKLKNNELPLTIEDDLQLINNNGQSFTSSSASAASVSNDVPGARSTECRSCGKIFANYPNLRRHIRTAHIVSGRFRCPQCPKTFTSEDLWVQHGQRAHPRDVETPILIIKCQQCKKVFDNNESHAQHLIDEHGIDEDDHLACDICGKRFSNETSLKIHRGHHFRRDSRLSIRNIPNPMEQVQVEIVEGTNEVNLSPLKHGKSSSSSSSSLSSPYKKLPISPNSKKIKINNYNELTNYTPDNITNLQCAVCDDNFNDVHDLRKHLWDVHCAKNKIENSFTNDALQCELCTNIFPDEQSLDEHMKWHKENPILSDVVGGRSSEISCDICGKFYSSIKSLTKHQKLHKTTQVASTMKFSSVKKNSLPATFACPICKKAFNNENSMKKHKAGAHYARRSASSIAAAVAAAAAAAATSSSSGSAASSPRKSSPSKIDNTDFRPKRPKLDFDVIRKAYNLGEPSGSNSGVNNQVTSPNSSFKKSVTCGLCKKILPSMSSLYKHRQNVHKIGTKSPNKNDINSDAADDDGVQCSDCFKIFSNSANMRQHYTKVHGNGEKHYCTIDDCNEEFDTSVAKQLHEKSHMSMLYSCNYCGRYMFNRGAIDNHLMTEHSSNINTDNADNDGDDDKNIHFKKVDLSDYEVKGADGRVCPVCLIKYPNIKAMKIHYVKIHEGNS